MNLLTFGRFSWYSFSAPPSSTRFLRSQAVSSTRGAVAHGAGTAVPRHARQRQSGASGQRRVTVRPPRVVRIKRILQKEPETRLGLMTFDGCCGWLTLFKKLVSWKTRWKGMTGWCCVGFHVRTVMPCKQEMCLIVLDKKLLRLWFSAFRRMEVKVVRTLGM